jgi:hypothetical protein
MEYCEQNWQHEDPEGVMTDFVYFHGLSEEFEVWVDKKNDNQLLPASRTLKSSNATIWNFRRVILFGFIVLGLN